ncbi:4273_t:CDS:2, partial [Entrophospora sp. SA101]
YYAMDRDKRWERIKLAVDALTRGIGEKTDNPLQHIITMTKYKTEFPFSVAFPPQVMDNVLAEWLSKNKIPQCHVA